MAKQILPQKDFSFKTEEEFEKWISKNHNTFNGIWVCMYKKDSRVKAISNVELIDVLLCYGWITGPAKKGNDSMFYGGFAREKRTACGQK